MRKPVIINQLFREKLYDTINDIETMLSEEYIPKATPNKNKCKKCDFKEFCADSYPSENRIQ
jgi:radical SAM protein with 4Fe4S-binding SPASM domain